MVFTQACLCPLFSTVFGLLAFFIGYTIAVDKDHVDAFLPYIRNFVVYEEKVEKNNLGKWKWIALFLMFLGMFAAVGAAMVANFQEGPQLATHDTGAFLFFIGICIYFWGQVFIALIYRPRNRVMFMIIIRLMLCIAITLFLIFHLTCLFFNPFIKKDSETGKKPPKPDFPNGIERYTKDQPFYWNHIATTLSEWILALLIETYVLTFTYDLALTCLESPTVRHHDDPFKSKHSTADTIYHSNQIAPTEPMLSNKENFLVMRKLPRLDTSGTYSRNGREDRGGSVMSAAPYDRSRMVNSYNQYEYY